MYRVGFFGLLVVLRNSSLIYMYVTAHRCADGLKEKVDLQLGSQRHRHFVGFLKVPVQHRNRAILSVRPQLDPSITQWDWNSQPKDDPPYAVSLDCEVKPMEQME